MIARSGEEGKFLFVAEPNITMQQFFCLFVACFKPNGSAGRAARIATWQISVIHVHRREIQKASSYCVHVPLASDQSSVDYCIQFISAGFR